MKTQTTLSRLILALCIALLFALSMPYHAFAGTNGQQLRIKNICFAQSVRVIGYNQEDKRRDISYSADPNRCVTIETNRWWWKGTVYVTVFYPDTTYQMVLTNVPKQQNNSDWWDVSIPTLHETVVRGYKWVKINVKYGSFDNDPNNDYYSVERNKYSNRPEDNTFYRTDCSGFVSYAWNLGKSLDTVGLGKMAKAILYSDLQPGDIINNNQSGRYGHVLLFVRWIDKNNLEFWAYEESGEQGTVLSTMRLVVDKNGKITELKKQYGGQFSTYGKAPWYAQRKP